MNLIRNIPEEETTPFVAESSSEDVGNPPTPRKQACAYTRGV